MMSHQAASSPREDVLNLGRSFHMYCAKSLAYIEDPLQVLEPLKPYNCINSRQLSLPSNFSNIKIKIEAEVSKADNNVCYVWDSDF